MKKFLNVFLILLAIVALTSCFAVNEVTSIEFTTAPAASYRKDEVVRADSFSVVISFTSGSPLTLKLNDSRLTVTGLDGDKLDTKTHGLKTINISYQGFSVSVSYNVEGQFLTYWKDNILEVDKNKTLEYFEQNGIANESQLAQFAKLVNETPAETAGKSYELLAGATFDLSAHEWDPIIGFQGKIDGNGATIKGLKITDGSDEKTDKGFIGKSLAGAEVKDLTFDGVFINSISDGLYDTNKNYAAVIGHVAGDATVENVTVVNSTIVGHGRIGAIVGMTVTAGTLTIKKSVSINNTFTAVNGYAAKSADGNGDKVAGLVGQAQRPIIIENSKVENVIINGTRDLGGLIGFASMGVTLTGNEVKNTIIQASVPGGMLPSKGTRSIGVLVGTVAGAAAGKVTDLVLGVDDDVNTYEEVTMLAYTLYEEITVTGVLFGGLRAKSDESRNIVIGDKIYQLKSLVLPSAETIAAYADDIAVITSFLLDVYKGNTPSLPAPTELLELTQLQ